MNFVWETPEEIIMGVAERLTRIRKRRKITQQELSVKSNVSYGSIKRFETSDRFHSFPLPSYASHWNAQMRSNACLQMSNTRILKKYSVNRKQVSQSGENSRRWNPTWTTLSTRTFQRGRNWPNKVDK